MVNDIRKYINVITEGIAPGSYTTQRADMEQKTLADKALTIEKTIDEFIKDGTYQGKKHQMVDNNGKPIEGSYVVEIYINFTFFQNDGPDIRRIRMPYKGSYFDVVEPVKTEDIKKLLDIVAQKYQKAGWRAESHYAGGEQGWLFLSHNISGTPQG